jgi:hypothetical protein
LQRIQRQNTQEKHLPNEKGEIFISLFFIKELPVFKKYSLISKNKFLEIRLH